MPQNPNQVLAGLNGGTPRALATDAEGKLLTIQSEVVPTTVDVITTTGTIASGGKFQAALAANPDRAPGGLILNASASKVLSVFFGAAADAKSGTSIPLAAGASLPLQNVLGAGNAYTGVIAVDGTTAETFVAVEVTKAS